MSENYDLNEGPDPAAVAAARPETDAARAESAVDAVGVGPGSPEYLTPRGRRAIREADVVVGFETVVEFVADETDAELLTCGYDDERETLEAFAGRVAEGASGTAALMGDPNHSGYQFVGKVQRAVDAPVRVVPGVSSLQVAASRARTPMEDAEFVTLHKSGDLTADLDRLRENVGERHLLVLPRPYDRMPEDIARTLVTAGGDETLDALVLERLTHPDESVTETTLGELATTGRGADESAFSDLSVLAVRAESSG
ncbi:cobalt-precorrin-7 (C(5))-methyltransferase [Halomicroarcula limicola]|uniref:Cobalt-precorrin-7 (C(5))-methyltransferase n=1 Tax=Haloarcula limicola TaxID=1429915 RepID=A0A8J7Y8K3_9EURY|nr:cobalt-precorrin-7 (C(5))-methyltransferase [Halomicroarcula limicola]MBV0926077.1 cobalt-precorrin-7 (C(5))-methyltransferase [Halomicroarcula limicola]